MAADRNIVADIDPERVRQGVSDLLRLITAWPSDKAAEESRLYHTEMEMIATRLLLGEDRKLLEAEQQFVAVVNELHGFALVAMGFLTMLRSVPDGVDPADIDEQDLLNAVQNAIERLIERQERNAE